jgi:argininosuccinate lyase
MAKLWQKEYELNALVEQFTVGNDPALDAKLIAYDCIGSIAHAHMLTSIGILTQEEYAKLKKSLLYIVELAKQNQFEIKHSDEDVHTAVENFLTQELGDLGKKIHTARSRNDQVALDLRMYMRDALLELMQQIVVVCETLIARAEETKNIPIPGRTHFQRAMPSSLGLFFGAYAESLLDTLSLVQQAYTLINQCPLGSAAGYGVALTINRQ